MEMFDFQGKFALFNNGTSARLYAVYTQTDTALARFHALNQLIRQLIS